MGAWPAIHLLAQVAVLLLTFRALGSRATLSFRQLLLCGAFGASVGTVVLTIVQYQVFDHIDPPSAFWAWAPAQDLVVVGFVALLAASSRRRWRMSVVDFALAGAAVAAGTATVQLLMQTIVHDGPAAWYRPSFFFAIAGALHVPALDFSFVGPYVYGVVIGLAFGIGARLRPATNLWIVTGVVGGLIAIADHAESLSRLGDAYVTLGSPDTATSIGVTPPGFSDVVRTLMLHGRLLFFVAFGGLLLANVAEGLVVGRRLPDTRALMLPDEPTRPVSVIEWFTGWSALRRGVSAMRSTFAYFRARRSLLLCVTLHAPADEASDLAARALVARSDVEGPDAARARGGNIMDWLRGAWPVVVALAAVVVGL
ncbi:MAG TPA: hypothetical protein VK461_03345, partial [Acidimicrobiales bacterium]|nr:hypothetical protein [Acidimicrobiales bacterium]